MATREFNFTVGPETADQPSAGTPSVDADLVTKGYADIHYMQGRLSCADVTAIKAVAAADRTNGDIVLNRATDKLYRFNSASTATGDDYNVLTPSAGSGRWVLIGSGSASTGEINCCTSPSDAANWVASGAGVTVATSTTAADLPLEGIISSCLKITGVSGTDYAKFRFTMPDALLNRKLKIEWFQITAGSYAAGDFKVDLYYNAASDYSGAYTRVALSTDSSSVSAIPALNGKYSTTFDDVSTNLYYELRIVRTAGTGNINLANIVIGPGIQPQGAAIDGWISYTPTFSAGWGTVTNKTGFYRRVGSVMELQIFGTTGTVAGSVATISIPTGVTIDTSKLFASSAASESNHVGTGSCDSTGDFTVLANNNTSANVLGVGGGSVPVTFQNGSVLFNNSKNFSLYARIPIAEWSSTVNIAQNDVEYVSNTSSTDASDTTSFAYGPSGSTGVMATTALTAARKKRVQFTTPIQQGDLVSLEVFNTLEWVPVSSLISATASYEVQELSYQNGATYGMGLAPVSGSTTQVDVVFGQYALASSTYGAAGGAWNTVASGFKFRVKKVSGGQAVGFGKQTDGSLSLVNLYTDSISTTFTADGSGGSSASKTVRCQRIGDWVTIHVPSTTLTSGTSSTKMTSNTALPSWARPLTATQGCGALAQMLDNNAQIAVPALVWVDTSGIITYQKTATGSTFTNSATMGTNIAHTHTYYVGTGS